MPAIRVALLLSHSLLRLRISSCAIQGLAQEGPWQLVSIASSSANLFLPRNRRPIHRVAAVSVSIASSSANLFLRKQCFEDSSRKRRWSQSLLRQRISSYQK